MSYLLDALRKSEAQRQLGELPTLTTAASYAAPARRGSWKGLLFVIALMAVGLVAFVGWREFTLPPPLAGEGRGGDEPELVAASDARDAREPLWEGAPPPTERVPASVGARGPSHRETPDEDRRRPAEPEPPAARPRTPDRAPEQAEKEVAAVGQDVTEPQATEPVEGFTPARREFVRQWELPASVRSELPELKIMAHIYSDNPENRFVLMNGRRYVEGDSLGDGATLAEIRREGAVVDFREYRFLVE